MEHAFILSLFSTDEYLMSFHRCLFLSLVKILKLDTLLFVKIATSRRKHVTEIKCIPQIRYMAIDKWLELQNCTWSVSMWFQYGVKPPCTAIRVSMHCGMGSKRPCISSRGMSLHAVYMQVQKASRVGAGGPWWISRRPTISQICSMGNMSGERPGQGSSDTCRLWKKACTILVTCGRALSCWNMACGVAWRRDSTSGCNTSLM